MQLERRYNLTAPTGVNGRNSDNSRIKAVLGWEPTTRLRDGLAVTYAWIRDQIVSGARARSDETGKALGRL